MMENADGWQIRVRGLVQGVGFRPTVWRLARRAGLAGHVLNDGEGVLIRIAGRHEAAVALAAAIRAEAPQLSRIDALEIEPCMAPGGQGFSIVASETGPSRAAVTPDAATCSDCLCEIADPDDRRFGYAFTNCTNCGPRLSILRTVPWDRPNTSMAPFKMCPACRREYQDPADRRFHAQPNACPDCGPQLWLDTGDGAMAGDTPLTEAARLLRAGRIVAIKGLGGWQLAACAVDEEALTRLRAGKRRPHKPLALMAAGIGMIRRFCRVGEREEEALRSAAAPIVLLRRRRAGKPLPETVAPGMNRLGFMLPATPLHHMLFAHLDTPLVLTSGNVTGNPQITCDREALAQLGGIADAFLGHDRGIVHRVDDSVVQFGAAGRQVLRHARGLAPAPLVMHPDFAGLPPVLAMGGDMKNAFCLAGGQSAMLSPHIGDMTMPRARRDLDERLALLRALSGDRPECVAIDAHPGYHTTRLGHEIAARERLAVVEVQHHHAHVAAVMAEAGLPPDAPPVLGIALDGLGWGSDGTIWGGEFLRADFGGFTRLAHFPAIALPGGDKASRQPWRNLLAHLHHAFGAEALGDLLGRGSGPVAFRQLADKPWKSLCAMIDGKLNAPLASSAGRLFDAVAAALDLCFSEQSHEGHAAMQLQALAERADGDVGGYPVGVDRVPDWRPLWEALIADLVGGIAPEVIAARFHHGLVAALGAIVEMLARETEIRRIVVAGGVFQNTFLHDLLVAWLERRGFEVLRAQHVPLNDGGLAVGQAAIARVVRAGAAGHP